MTETIDKPPDIDNEKVLLSSSNEQKILSDELPPLDIVRQMITYETSLRLSDSVQELFELYHTDDNAITYVNYFLYV